MTALPPLPFSPLSFSWPSQPPLSCELRQPARRPAPSRRGCRARCSRCLAVAGLAQLLWSGPINLSLGSGAALLAVRLDPVSATMALLVSFVGWVVVRYSRTYLDGEPREGRFHGLMLATLAAVLLLVQSASLAVLVLSFIAVGLGLRQLLLFYPERPEARRAAAKFSLVWGAGDVALILAAVLLVWSFGTADLQSLAQAAGSGLPLAAQFAVAFLVVCGCAQDGCLSVPRLAHRGDGGTDTGLRTASCRHHQLGRRAAHHHRAAGAGEFRCHGGPRHDRRPDRALRGCGHAHPERREDGTRLVDRGADGLHAAAVRPWSVDAGAAAHRGAFALQGPCLPRFRRRGARRGAGAQARPSGRAGHRRGRQGLPPRADALCGRGDRLQCGGGARSRRSPWRWG